MSNRSRCKSSSIFEEARKRRKSTCHIMTKLLSGPSPPIPSPVPHLLIAQCVQKEQLRTTIVLKMTLLIVLAGWGQYFHVLVTHHDFSVFYKTCWIPVRVIFRCSHFSIQIRHTVEEKTWL